MSDLIKPPDSAFTAAPKWSREQTLLAFQFYCETSFGQLHHRNKNVIALAGLIGRTPDALAMKCSNMASLDPKIRESGRTGLSNASAMDREVWNEFHADWDGLIAECEALLAYLVARKGGPTLQDDAGLYIEPDYSGEMRLVLAKQRVGQEFFRRSVLSSYGGKCCISGVTDKRLLWSPQPPGFGSSSSAPNLRFTVGSLGRSGPNLLATGPASPPDGRNRA